MNTVQELEAHIASNPSDVHAMLSLIDLYQDQGDTGDKLNQIRTQYTSYVIPDVSFWSSWITDTVIAVQNNTESVSAVSSCVL